MYAVHPILRRTARPKVKRTARNTQHAEWEAHCLNFNCSNNAVTSPQDQYKYQSISNPDIIYYQCNEDTFFVVRLTSTQHGHKSTTDVMGVYKLENKMWFLNIQMVAM